MRDCKAGHGLRSWNQGKYAIYRVFDVDGDVLQFHVLERDIGTLLPVKPDTYRACPA